jgi:hypothetical protein
MKRHHDLDNFIDEAAGRQRNIVFPDTVRNGRSVDAYLWSGSPDAPFVQRIGAWLIGLCLAFAGLSLLSLGFKEESRLLAFFSLPCILLGVKIFLNGCRRHKGKPEPK